MTDDVAPRRAPNGDEAWVRTPGGFGGGVRGPNTLVLVAFLAFALALLVFQRWEHQRIEGSVTTLVEEAQTQNWLLSIPIEQRPALAMPPHVVRRLAPGSTR